MLVVQQVPLHARARVPSCAAPACAVPAAESASLGAACSAAVGVRSSADVAAAACCSASVLQRSASRLVVLVPGERWVPKVGFSSPSEEKLTDPGGPGPYLRMAGSGRGPVVGPSPRRRLCPRHRKSGGHLRPAKPGHGGRSRQRLGWEKVCGTAWSGGPGAKGWVWGLYATLSSRPLQCGLDQEEYV